MIGQVSLHVVGDKVGALRRAGKSHEGKVVEIQRRHADDHQCDQRNYRDPEPGLNGHLFGKRKTLGRAGTRFRLGGAILLQLVEKSLQADTQDFSRACFVVPGVLEGNLDEQLPPR